MIQFGFFIYPLIILTTCYSISLGWSPIGFYPTLSNVYLDNTRQINQQQIQHFPGIKPNPQRHITNTLILPTCLLSLQLYLFLKLFHILIMLSFLIYKLCILFISLHLYKLYLDWSSCDDAFAFWEKLFADYAL